MLIRGIDIAHYDAVKQMPGGTISYIPLEWNKYDWDFAFIKASEGTVIDKAFKVQWAAAKGYTLRGAYHFFRSFVDPKLAAQSFANILDGDMGELPPVLDLESTDNRSDAIARAIIWLDEFRRITHIRPIVYTSSGFISSNKLYEYIVLADYKLWLAQYPWDNLSEATRMNVLHSVLIGEKQFLMPQPPKPFKRLSFLQWTGKGSPADVPGYISDKLAVDFNFYNGPSIEDMIAEFYIQYIPPTQEEIKMIYGRMKVITNIRSSLPGGAYADIGDLPAGALIEADTKQQINGVDWYHLKKATVNGIDIKTTSGKLVGDVEAWTFGANVEEIDSIPDPSSNLPDIPITTTFGDDITYIKQTINITLKPK